MAARSRAPSQAPRARTPTWDSLAGELDEKYGEHCQEVLLNEEGTPWVGVIEVDFGLRGPSRYFIGRCFDQERRIVPLTHSMAEAYYELDPGERVEGSRRPGRILWKGHVDGRGSELTQVDFRHEGGNTLVVKSDGQWAIGEAPQPRDPLLSDVLGLLTKEQFALVKMPESHPLVIEGQAGSGKTSVALYRLKYICTLREEAKQLDPEARFLVVMFNPSLVRYVSHLMEQAGIGNVELVQFYDWAEARIRDAYKGELRRDPRTSERPGFREAWRLKKRIEILRAVDDWLDAQEARVLAFLEAKLGELRRGDALVWLTRFQETTGPLVRRLSALRAEAKTIGDRQVGLMRDLHHQIHRVFGAAIEGLTRYKEELFRILTDRNLLERAFPNEPKEALEALVAYQRAVQGEGATDRRPGPNIGPGDEALLLHIIRRKNGGYPLATRDTPLLYEHVLVDEAQDFGAAELSVILASVKDRRCVTIAGDANQRVMPDVDFGGWALIASQLGLEGVTVERLAVSHRSAPEILRLANAIMGVAEPVTKARPEEAPMLWTCESEEKAREKIFELGKALQDAHPKGHVLVATASEREAERLVGGRTGFRHVAHGGFEFAPGVSVASIPAVKGLEFDAVIVYRPDAERFFGEDGQRLLYTAVTRARSRVDVVVIGDDLAPPLRAALELGALRPEAIVDVDLSTEGDGVL